MVEEEGGICWEQEGFIFEILVLGRVERMLGVGDYYWMVERGCEGLWWG